jgi:hypothetical protein
MAQVFLIRNRLGRMKAAPTTPPPQVPAPKLIDLGKRDETNDLFVAAPVSQAQVPNMIDLGKRETTSDPFVPLPVGQPHVPVMIDFGKRHETPSLASELQVNRPSVPVMIDFGKRDAPMEPVSPLTSSPTPVPVMIDLGKRDEPMESVFPLTSSPTPVPVMIDLGKHPESEEPTVDTSIPVPNMIDLGTQPEQEISLPQIVSSSTVSRWLKFGGAAAAVVFFVWLVPHFALPAQTSMNTRVTVDTANGDLALALPAQAVHQLQLTQIWQSYERRLQELAPGSDPTDTWWEIAAARHLTAAQAEVIHQLQTGAIQTFEQVRGPATSTSNGSLTFLVATKNRLKEQQTPPSQLVSGASSNGPRTAAAPLEDLAGFPMQ